MSGEKNQEPKVKRVSIADKKLIKQMNRKIAVLMATMNQTCKFYNRNWCKQIAGPTTCVGYIENCDWANED